MCLICCISVDMYSKCKFCKYHTVTDEGVCLNKDCASNKQIKRWDNPVKDLRNNTIAKDRLTGMTYRELAKIHGITYGQVGQILKRKEIKEIVDQGTAEMIGLVPLAVNTQYRAMADYDKLPSLAVKAGENVLKTTSIIPSNVQNQTISTVVNVQNNITLNQTVADAMQGAFATVDEDVIECTNDVHGAGGEYEKCTPTQPTQDSSGVHGMNNPPVHGMNNPGRSTVSATEEEGGRTGNGSPRTSPALTAECTQNVHDGKEAQEENVESGAGRSSQVVGGGGSGSGTVGGSQFSTPTATRTNKADCSHDEQTVATRTNEADEQSKTHTNRR